MPLRDDLLNPIPGENPSGVHLRYDRIYDQIKEARTEDDDSLPTGAWQRQVKRADSQLVIKLAGEALATKSKDLQLVAWLTEALLKREGISALQPCLLLFLNLQEQFWDTLYPEIDEGDAGMRAVPIEWSANRAAALLREAPLTRSGLTYYQYKDSRSVGYEADAQYDDAKREARERAIQDGKITPEAFDSAFAATPKTTYADLDVGLEAAATALSSLQEFCEEKYGEDGPAFNKLRASIEEVHHVVKSLLAEKRLLEPAPVAEEEAIEEVEPEPEPQEAPEAEAAGQGCCSAQESEVSVERTGRFRRCVLSRACVRIVSCGSKSHQPRAIPAADRPAVGRTSRAGKLRHLRVFSLPFD